MSKDPEPDEEVSTEAHVLAVNDRKTELEADEVASQLNILARQTVLCVSGT